MTAEALVAVALLALALVPYGLLGVQGKRTVSWGRERQRASQVAVEAYRAYTGPLLEALVSAGGRVVGDAADVLGRPAHRGVALEVRLEPDTSVAGLAILRVLAGGVSLKRPAPCVLAGVVTIPGALPGAWRLVWQP